LNYTPVPGIQKLIQRVIKQVKRHKRPDIFIGKTGRGFLKEGYHWTFALGKMFSGSAVFAYSRKDISQQIKLIRHKRIICRKVFWIFKKFFLSGIGKHDKVFNGSRFIVIKKRKCLSCGAGFFEDTFPYYFAYIGGRQWKPGIKTSLNFWKIVAPCRHVFGYWIDVFLTGYNNPCSSLTDCAKVFDNGLKIQHKAWILTDKLPHFIDHKNNTPVFPFAIKIFFYKLCKFFVAYWIRRGYFFAPVTGSFLAHNCGNNIVLDKTGIVSGIFPGVAFFHQKYFFKVFEFVLFFKPALKVSDVRIRTAKPLHFIENF